MQDETIKRRRRVWTKEEDEKLKILVEEKKLKNWVMVSSYFKNRSNKDCRDRYFLHLSPNVVKRKWTAEEEDLLLAKFQEYGSKWVKLSSFFDKRSPNDLKNRIKLIQKRKKPLKKEVLQDSKSSSDTSSQTYSPCEDILSLPESIKVKVNVNLALPSSNQIDFQMNFLEDFENLIFSNDTLANLKLEVDRTNTLTPSINSIFEMNTSNENYF